ncbi:MAG: HlyD family efflux transporter periplasmic adaptor subunit [Methylococcaceae bacterium]|nr:HlyD family efflux transporter periplasmic adaptor subunit [Methylococcaceae bacterium]
MSATPNPQLQRLTVLLQLERRARLATAQDLPFTVVNATGELIHYRQAVLWRNDLHTLTAASGVATPDANSPYALWLNPALQTLSRLATATDITAFTAAQLPHALAAEWAEFVPSHGLWIPLPAPLGSPYVLVLFRDPAWTPAEMHLLSYLAEAYGHALALSHATPPPLPWRVRLRLAKTQLLLGGVLAVIACLPIRQSVLAEAEVIPYHAHLVRAPLDGVVDSFMVQPNAQVSVGQALFALDRSQLQSRLNVAQATRDIAQTEYLQATQQALQDPVAKAQLAGLKSKWEQQNAETEYVSSLLERCLVKATQAGVAVFDDPNDWLGRPVSQGEKILAIADPNAVELEIRLPMDDLIELQAGDEVLFFANVSPHQPLPARLSYFSYRASPTPAAIMAYRLKAQFTDLAALPRLGYRGSAKLYGTRRPLLAWLLRKPLHTLRLWLTW